MVFLIPKTTFQTRTFLFIKEGFHFFCFLVIFAFAFSAKIGFYFILSILNT